MIHTTINVHKGSEGTDMVIFNDPELANSQGVLDHLQSDGREIVGQDPRQGPIDRCVRCRPPMDKAGLQKLADTAFEAVGQTGSFMMYDRREGSIGEAVVPAVLQGTPDEVCR